MSVYTTARDRLAAMLENLNTDDDGPVMLLYPMTVADYHNPDAQPLLGVIADGDLVALAEHRCDLTTLRAEVERLMIDSAEREASAAQAGSAIRANGRVAAYGAILDLIDKHTREGQ